MSREEIAKKLNDLSSEMYALGRICTEQHFEENETFIREMFYVAGEFLKNTSFTMDSFADQINP